MKTPHLSKERMAEIVSELREIPPCDSYTPPMWQRYCARITDYVDDLLAERAADVALLRRVYDWPESDESLRQIGEDIEAALREKGEL